MAKSKSRPKRKESIDFAWHPDFRIQESLPDVKVVRTGFIINFITLTAAVLLMGLYGYRQLHAWNLSSQIEEVKAEIEVETPENRVNLKQSGEFKQATNLINDLTVFYKQSESVLEFLVEISQSKPDYIALSNIESSELTRTLSKSKTATYNRYNLTGVLQGSSAEALDALNKYREIISNLEIFKDKIDSIDVPPPRRNPTLDLFEFNIVIVLKPVES